MENRNGSLAEQHRELIIRARALLENPS